MYFKSRLLSAVIGCFILSNVFAAPVEKFISIADIHFDPFLGCEKQSTPCPLIQKLSEADVQDWNNIFKEQGVAEVSTYSQDSSYPLLMTALSEIKTVQAKEHPAFVLVLGDFLAHDFKGRYKKYSGDGSSKGYQAFVQKTMQFLTQQIKQVFPTIDVYPAIGNNDSYTGNYTTVPKGPFLADMQATWSQFISNKSNQQEFKQTFANAGFYSVTLSNKNLLIVLNTTLFSSLARNGDMSKAAGQELAWLERQLKEAAAKHQHVLLAFHIPMGIDVHTTLKDILRSAQLFWKEPYNKEAQRILECYPNVVTGILPAHIHMDAFQMITLTDGTRIPVPFTPAISPVYGNNPAFKVFSYDGSTLKLKNFEVYSLALTDESKQWNKEYSFNEVYQSECTQCDLTTGMETILSNDNLRLLYEKYFNVSGASSIASYLNYYLCGSTSFTVSQYDDCTNQKA